ELGSTLHHIGLGLRVIRKHLVLMVKHLILLTANGPVRIHVHGGARGGDYEVILKGVCRIRRRDADAMVAADHVDPHRGIAGDSVALHYYFVAGVGDALLSKVQLRAPGLGSGFSLFDGGDTYNS
ncbi:hypothetical protein FOZ63_000706, partial [Perkinsus olseni]